MYTSLYSFEAVIGWIKLVYLKKYNDYKSVPSVEYRIRSPTKHVTKSHCSTYTVKDQTYDDGIEMPSGFKNLCAPSRHSGDSSLSPKEPNNSLTCIQNSSSISKRTEDDALDIVSKV